MTLPEALALCAGAHVAETDPGFVSTDHPPAELFGANEPWSMTAVLAYLSGRLGEATTLADVVALAQQRINA